jgi:hypothetical protein
MAIGEHAIQSGSYSTQSITANTNVRDVSDLLDLWAHTWTPVLNRIKWGPDSGGLVAEWVSEHLGFGYVVNSAQLASAGTSIVIASGTGGLSKANQMKQIQEGTMLMAHKGSGTVSFWVVSSAPSTGTITFSCLANTSSALTADSKLYIVGHFANEGSDPFADRSRARTLLSNKFAILRQDIKITGSEKATDMYAVSNEPSHQLTNRLIELQKDRQSSILYSTGQARTSTAASYLYGCLGFLNNYTSEDWVDTSTTSLTETAVNNMAAELYDNGAEGPMVLCGDVTQMRKFTSWDQARIRTVPDGKLGGHHVTRYLCDTGIELELLPLRKAPTNLLFMLDTSNMELRAKKGRKLIVEDLAKVGDYERKQIISEYTFIMRGYDKGYHGMFTALA